MATSISHTIQEISRLSGLPQSTLRYYETIGIIPPIERGPSSKQRVYTQRDLDLIEAISCLSATGLSIEDMRAYMKNRSGGKRAAKDQVKLLQTQKAHLDEEAAYQQLRLQYVNLKIAYWRAVADEDQKKMEQIAEKAKTLSKRLRQTRTDTATKES